VIELLERQRFVKPVVEYTDESIWPRL